MKLFKGLLTIFVVTFCLSSIIVSAATEYHWLIGVSIPKWSGKVSFPTNRAVVKSDSTKQTLKTTYTSHGVKARVQLCLNSAGTSCAGDYTWVEVPTGSTKTMTNGNQVGNFKLQLMTVYWQGGSTEYHGEWAYQQ